MVDVIAAEDKREFLKDFLRTYTLKRRECVWILNYIADQKEEFLNNFHIIDDPEDLDNVIMMSTICSDADFAFQMKFEDRIIHDPEEAFHKIRLNKSREFYIVLETGDSLYNLDSYIKVLEENPKATLPAEYSREAERLLEKLTKDLEVRQLQAKIDEAIDNNDREAFITYSEQLKILKSS